MEDLSSLLRSLDPVPGYDGPGEIRPFADFLPFIGEVIIAFALLERRLTWAIESCLRISPEEADAIQETVISVATRIGMFATLTARHVAETPERASDLENIVKRLRKMNDYRNFIVHGPWYGISGTFSSDGTPVARAAMKAKYAQLGSKDLIARQREHSKEEMREYVNSMLKLCADIHVFILAVFPHAENRVP